jgi:hypothetical protein
MKDSPVEEFDDIIVRPDFNSSWRHWSDTSGNGNGRSSARAPRGCAMRSSKNTFRDMGDLASHHRFIHLFINGLYWGTYDFAEQPVDGFGASYLGGVKADYDVIHEGNVRAGDGRFTRHHFGAGDHNQCPLRPDEGLSRCHRVHRLHAAALLHRASGLGQCEELVCGPPRASTLNPTQGKYMYIPWDDECTLLESNVNRVSNTDVPSGIHTKLVSHPQYRLDFADRVQRHLIAPNGAMTSPAMVARFQNGRP